MNGSQAQEQRLLGRFKGWMRAWGRGWRDLPWDYGIDERSWPAVFSLLTILLVVLVLTFPAHRELRDLVENSTAGGAVFLIVFLVVFGVAAITLGQAEEGWYGRLPWAGSLVHLGVRVALVLLLCLPFWLVFQAVFSPEGVRLLLALQYLWLFGTVLSLFGWWLALSAVSELVQFNVKYLAFFGLLFGSLLLPGVQVLSPFRALDLALWGEASEGGSLLVGELAWLGLGGLLAAAAYRRWQRYADIEARV